MPPKPTVTPRPFRGVNRSSGAKTWASTTVASGTTASRIAARPLSTVTSPQLIRKNGTTLPITATTRKPRQMPQSRGSRRPVAARNSNRASAARPSRAATRVIGGMVATASLMNRKEEPQIAESRSSSR